MSPDNQYRLPGETDLLGEIYACMHARISMHRPRILMPPPQRQLQFQHRRTWKSRQGAQQGQG
eukprot:scaffold157819_cov18-Tisochrysis_lutea.AAC.1